MPAASCRGNRRGKLVADVACRAPVTRCIGAASLGCEGERRTLQLTVACRNTRRAVGVVLGVGAAVATTRSTNNQQPTKQQLATRISSQARGTSLRARARRCRRWRPRKQGVTCLRVLEESVSSSWTGEFLSPCPFCNQQPFKANRPEHQGSWF